MANCAKSVRLPCGQLSPLCPRERQTKHSMPPAICPPHCFHGYQSVQARRETTQVRHKRWSKKKKIVSYDAMVGPNGQLKSAFLFQSTCVIFSVFLEIYISALGRMTRKQIDDRSVKDFHSPGWLCWSGTTCPLPHLHVK